MKKNPIHENDATFSCKKKSKSFIKKLKNPEISHINEDSQFIYDDTSALKYFKKLKNKNLIKPSEEEISLLKNIINEINIKKLLLSKKDSIIDVPEIYAEKILNFHPKCISEINELIDFIRETIQKSSKRENISCRKLALLYEKKFKKIIGKSTIHKIIRNKLNLRYLKTTYKTRKIEAEKNKVYSFYFIKAFIKFIKLGFNLIFIDESKFELKNNHFRCQEKRMNLYYFGKIIILKII